MKAKVSSLLVDRHSGKDRVTVIHGKTVKVGDVIDTDENTFRNLANKGVLEAHDKEAKEVDLGLPSQLTEAAAEANVEATIEAREAEAAKKVKAAKRIPKKK